MSYRDERSLDGVVSFLDYFNVLVSGNGQWTTLAVLV